MGEVRVRDAAAPGLMAKLVTKPVVSAAQVLVHTQSLYVTDGTSLWLTVALEVAGLDLSERAGRLATDGALHAGGLAVTGAAGIAVTTPDWPGTDSSAYFNSPDTIGLTQEQAAFRLAADPRGYGNPDAGWRHTVATTAFEADPVPVAPGGLTVFAVRYGPAHADEPFAPVFERTDTGLLVTTEAFSALIGSPEGDATGEPVLELRVPGGRLSAASAPPRWPSK